VTLAVGRRLRSPGNTIRCVTLTTITDKAGPAQASVAERPNRAPAWERERHHGRAPI